MQEKIYICVFNIYENIKPKRNRNRKTMEKYYSYCTYCQIELNDLIRILKKSLNK